MHGGGIIYAIVRDFCACRPLIRKKNMNIQNSTHTLDVGEKEVFDLIGIGIGPFNLGLAALLSSIDTHKSVFFDTKHEFSWHEGLLLEDCYLQVPFLADLVTMSDPTNPY